MERTHEELRLRKTVTEEALGKILRFVERIAEWKREEERIGKDRYPIYEAVKSVVPEVDEHKVVSFIDTLFSHLKERKLLFDGWQ